MGRINFHTRCLVIAYLSFFGALVAVGMLLEVFR